MSETMSEHVLEQVAGLMAEQVSKYIAEHISEPKSGLVSRHMSEFFAPVWCENTCQKYMPEYANQQGRQNTFQNMSQPF